MRRANLFFVCEMMATAAVVAMIGCSHAVPPAGPPVVVTGEGAVIESDDAGEWPQFHGTAGDNRSTETGLLRTWPADGPRLAWTASGIGAGFSGPSIHNGRIAIIGSSEDERTTLFCLNADGKGIYHVKLDTMWTENYPGSRSSPMFFGENIYVETPRGLVVCLRAADGEVLWECDLVEKYDVKIPMWGRAEAPIAITDAATSRIIVGVFTDTAGFVGLDPATGEEIWKSEPVRGDVSYTTPAVAVYEGRRMILSMSGYGLVAVDAENGKSLFDYEKKTRFNIHATPPVYSDGQIFITSGYGTSAMMLRLSGSGDSWKIEPVWESATMDNQHGGVVLEGGVIFGAAHQHRPKWVSLDWNDGHVVWTAESVGQGSVTFADGRFYIVGENERNRDVALIGPNEGGNDAYRNGEYQEYGRFQLPAGGSEKVWAHPVVCGGRLYIRHGDLLFCYDIRQGS